MRTTANTGEKGRRQKQRLSKCGGRNEKEHLKKGATQRRGTGKLIVAALKKNERTRRQGIERERRRQLGKKKHDSGKDEEYSTQRRQQGQSGGHTSDSHSHKQTQAIRHMTSRAKRTTSKRVHHGKHKHQKQKHEAANTCPEHGFADSEIARRASGDAREDEGPFVCFCESENTSYFESCAKENKQGTRRITMHRRMSVGEKMQNDASDNQGRENMILFAREHVHASSSVS